MQKRKRRYSDQTPTQDDQTYQSKYGSAEEQTNSETPELNNNYMPQSKDTAPQAIGMGIDLLLKMNESRTKVIPQHTDTESKELTLNATAENNYSASNNSETSLSSFLQEIDWKISAGKLRTKCTPTLRSKPQNMLVKSEMTETSKDPSYDTDATSAIQVQTDSISQILKAEDNSICKPRGRLVKKLIKSREIVTDDNFISETGDALTDNRPGVSLSDKEYPTEYLSCIDGDGVQKTQTKLGPMAIDNGLECANKNISLAKDIQTDLLSKTLKSELKCAPKRRGRQPKNLIRSEKIMVDNIHLTTTEDMFPNSWLDIVSKSDTDKNLPCDPESTLEERMIELEPVEISDDLNSAIADTPLTHIAGIDSSLKAKAKFVCKPRGRRTRKLTKSRKNVMGDDLSIHNSLESEFTSALAQPEQTRLREPAVKGSQWRRLVNSEPRKVDSNVECQAGNTPVATGTEIDSTSEISQPQAKCRGRGRKPKRMIPSEVMEMNITPGCDIKDLSFATQVGIDSTIEMREPVANHTCETRTNELLGKLETIDQVGINFGSDTKNTPLVPQVASDLIFQTPESKTKRERKPLAKKTQEVTKSTKMIQYINSESKLIDGCSATQMETSLTSETIKSKPNCTCGTKAEKPEVLLESHAVETACYHIMETEDKSLDNCNVKMLKPMIKQFKIKPRTKRPRTGTLIKLQKRKKMKRNNDFAGKTESLSPKSSLQTDSLPESLKIEGNTTHNSEEKFQRIQYGIDRIAAEPTTRSDDQLDNTVNLSPGKHNLRCSIAETVETKYPVLDKMSSPIVLLQNIAYSNILSSEQKESLFKNKQSSTIFTPKDSPHSSTDQSIRPRLAAPCDIIHKIFLEPGKRHDESVKRVLSMAVYNNEQSKPKKRRVRTKDVPSIAVNERSKSRKRRFHGKEKTKRRGKVSDSKNWDKMYTSKLVLRNSETNSQSRIVHNVLSAVGNEELNIYKCSPTTELFLKQGSSTQLNNFGKELSESTIPSEGEIAMWPLPEVIELQIPLDLSIRQSDKSTSIQSDFSKCDDSIEEIYSRNSKHQTQDVNMRDTGSGSSSLNVIDLNRSFIDIDDGTHPVQAETTSQLLMGEKDIHINENPTPQKSHCQDDTITFYEPPKSAEKIFPTTSTTFECANRPAKPIRTYNRAASMKLKKIPPRQTFAIKVSLPAEHYFNNKLSTYKKSDALVEPESVNPGETNTESYTVLNETNYQASNSITCLTFDQEPGRINLLPTESQTLAEDIGDQCLGLSAPLPDTCESDTEVALFQETLRKCEIDHEAASQPTSPGPLMTSKITDIRSLPKIITDQLLPKGAITISSRLHRFATNIENESHSENQVNECPEICELTTVNESLSELTTCFQDQPHASTSTGSINISTEAVGNLEEFKDSHGENDKRGTDGLQSNDTDQGSIADQNFDSTELWKICPELEDYYSHDDCINNNDNKNLSNFDAPNTVKSINNDDRLQKLPTEMEIETNVDSSTDLKSNNVIRVAANADNLRDVFEGVVASANVYCNETEMESSEYIDPQNVSDSPKCSMIANLTAANLRNFNNISNHNKDGLNWSAETCQYYITQGDVMGCGDKPIPKIAAVETSCGATDSTSESPKQFFQAEPKKRKRKWLEGEKNTCLKPINEKRLKLNRNRWSIDGQDSADLPNSPKPTSVSGSINSDNITTSNVVENRQLSRTTYYSKSDQVKQPIELEPNIATKRTEVSKNNDKSEELDEKIVDSIQAGTMENTEVPTAVPVDIVDSETPRPGFQNDSCLRSELYIMVPQNVKNDDSDSSSVDRNGNLRSPKSSSPSLSSQSSKSMSIHRGSTCSKNSNEDNRRIVVPEPREYQCQEEQDLEDEVDQDCISLFAESLFTTISDQPTNFNADAMSPTLYDISKRSEENFQDMTDVGAYFDRNVQECNEAYDDCMQEDGRMHYTPAKTTDVFTNGNYDRIIPQLPVLNLNQLNFSQPTQYFEHDSYPLTPVQDQNSSRFSNLKQRLGDRQNITDDSSFYARGLFHKHCFQKLRLGKCTRDHCFYFHHLSPDLENLDLQTPVQINEVLEYALFRNYDYFIQHVYPRVIRRLDYLNIMTLFYKLHNKNLLKKEYLIECTIDAVTKTGTYLRTFLSDVASLLCENDETIANIILRAVSSTIKFGTYWDTCRDLLIKAKPSSVSATRVICECIRNKNKPQIQDVYVNYMRRLTAEQKTSININLRAQFDLLLENDSCSQPQQSNWSELLENVNPEDGLFSNNIDQDNSEDKSDVQTILSPDDSVCQNYDTSLPLSPVNKQISQKFSLQESHVVQTLVENQDTGTSSTTSNHSPLYQKKGSVVTQVSSELKQQSPDLGIRTTDHGPENSSDSSYKLHMIDNLQPPRSVFRDRHWMFYLEMNNLKEALKHSEYSLALNILDKYSQVEKTIFMSSCYQMLRKNVMTSAYHVKNIIKLSVRMRVNKFLNETLVNLGMYMMIELCNINAWVLAYSLFKSLQYSASLMENIAAFVLISAEIYLANRRPLKAFTILKQNNMLCTSRNRWNVVSEPNDEHNRVVLIDLLLDVLCEEYPDRALYILTYLIKDQTRIYHPVDLTAHIDKLVMGILNSKCNHLITDVGRLIIENNFTLKTVVFQSLIANLYQNDITLCRQLYRYGTWLGVYSIVKLALPVHISIKTNWTKEEMHLVIVDFLEKLSIDIGPTIDRISPNQFSIHLVFELAPFKQQLPGNNVQISNTDELTTSKELMKNVLREHFNPPLKTVMAERDRFMKLQSRSVVDYLKSMVRQI